MLFAKIHAYNGNSTTIATCTDQPNIKGKPDPEWQSFNITDPDHLEIINGIIQIKDQATLDADAAVAIAKQAAVDLAATDQEMARVGEDLVNVLITKGIIALSDLPQSAQDKIAQRAALRNKL